MRVGKKYASARALLAAGRDRPRRRRRPGRPRGSPSSATATPSRSTTARATGRSCSATRGLVGRIDDFARFGATASSGWHINFAQQLQRWRRAGRPLGVTVVYLGFNDVGVRPRPVPGRLPRPGSTSWSRPARPRAATACCSSSRTTSAARRSTTARPSAATCAGRPRTGTGSWPSPRTTSHATRGRRVRGDRPGAGAPAPYGFTNVTTADHAHAATTALYDDDFHVGQHGQAIIADTIAARLGGRLAVRRLADARAGLGEELDEARHPGPTRRAGSPPSRSADPAPDTAPEAEDPARPGWRRPTRRHLGRGQGNSAWPTGSALARLLGVVLTRYAEHRPGFRWRPAPPPLARLGRGAGPPRAAAGAAGARQRAGLQPEPLAVALKGERDNYVGRTVELAPRAGLPLKAAADYVTPWPASAPRAQGGDGEASRPDARLGRPRRRVWSRCTSQAGRASAAAGLSYRGTSPGTRAGGRRCGPGGGRAGLQDASRSSTDARAGLGLGRAARGQQRSRAGARPRGQGTAGGPKDAGHLGVSGPSPSARSPRPPCSETTGLGASIERVGRHSYLDLARSRRSTRLQSTSSPAGSSARRRRARGSFSGVMPRHEASMALKRAARPRRARR